MPCRVALPIALWAVLAATTLSSAAGVTARAGDRTIHTFGVSDWTVPALAAAAATAGPRPGVAPPPPPAFRDVRVCPLPDGSIAVEVPASTVGPRVLPLFTLSEPGIVTDDYAVVGRVRYGGNGAAIDMDGTGYLELWSEFPDGGRYFTRTLADDGPLGRLIGHSASHSFRLPFHAADRRPTRLTLDLVLPGRAAVTLSDVHLVEDVLEPPATQTPPDGSDREIVYQAIRARGDRTMATDLDVRRAAQDRVDDLLASGYGPASNAMSRATQALDQAKRRVEDCASTYLAGDPGVADPGRDRSATRPAGVIRPGPWWARDGVTARAVELFGLIAGLAGGVVGCLAPVLVRRGRGRWVSVALLVAVGLVGETFVAWGMAVLGHGDGPASWRPLLTAGLVGLCMPALIPVVTAGRREAELRRMRAADAVTA